ncbi:MAG TPA: putative hydro-lyase [Kineosporiaceae bacterium]|nr:putative hydro-lyase [Kineosporiaceae bacterium]
MLDSLTTAAPDAARLLFRAGLRRPTAGLSAGFQQANLVCVPRQHAFDFLLFTARNPQPCPVVDVVETGGWTPEVAPGADLRTDLPGYRIWRGGNVEAEVSDVRAVWRTDLVSFLLGCSFTFEHALMIAGIRLRHVEQGRNVAMFDTSTPCRSAGIFSGNLVVSMRPILIGQLDRVRAICAAMPWAHGAPVHVGDPSELGISDLQTPDYGDPIEIQPGEVPVFWACGVTTQNVLRHSQLSFAITHAPGFMFVTDKPAMSA